MALLKKICLTCWIEFETHSSRAKYCSRKCKDNATVEKKCAVCWIAFVWIKSRKCCSEECSLQLAKEKRKETFINKYWVDNWAKLDSVKEKQKATMNEKYWWRYTWTDEYKNKRINTSIEKYWVEHYSKTKEYRDKTKNTCLEKYWETSYSKTEEYKEKVINTNLEKYWDIHFMRTEEWKDRVKQTIKDKYWVDSYTQTYEYLEKTKATNIRKYWKEFYSQSDESKEKIKNTCVEKYWVDNVMKVDEIKEKVKQTNLERRWVDNAMKVQEIKEKVRNTTLDRYWEKFYTQTEEWIKKISETCQERYNVPFYCMTKKCTNASSKNSKTNIWIQQMFIDNWFSIDDTDYLLWRYQYDIKIWDTLIEINPSVTHCSESLKKYKYEKLDKYYHRDKTLFAKKEWYRCINVFDWDSIDKVITMLKPKETIYARNCEVKQITYEDAHELFETYHLQWDTIKRKKNIYIWLYYNDKLVECMSFWIPRYNDNHKREILRLCTHWMYSVVWWASKIFKYFVNEINPSSVISYCDMSKFDGSVYEQLWFKLEKFWEPSKHWRYMWKKKIWCPMHITAKLLMSTSFDKLLWKYFWEYWKWTSNDELMLKHWYVWVYDAWQATYVRHKEKEEN